MTDEDGPHVVEEHEEHGVAVFTLNRPRRGNALTAEMLGMYYDALARADDDPKVRAIVLTGAGRKFSVGADANELQEVDGATPLEVGDRPMTFPLQLRKPLVGALNGSAAGLGLLLALMCDVRFAVTDARFSTAYVRRGVIAEHGISWLLPRIIGRSRALDLLLSGRVVTTAEAHTMRLVDHVVEERGQLLRSVVDYAQDLGTYCSPMAMATVKQQVLQDATRDLDSAVADADQLLRQALDASDFREGVASLRESRPPAFAPLPSRTRARKDRA